MIEHTRRIVDITHPVVKQHHGLPVEEFLFVFSDALQAFLAARHLKEEIERFNTGVGDNEKFAFTGIAAHAGHLLIVPGTNVHWGDPVNTASKLAEDIASHGELLITEPIYQQVQSSGMGHHHAFHPQTFTTSRVELTCFEVHPRRR